MRMLQNILVQMVAVAIMPAVLIGSLFRKKNGYRRAARPPCGFPAVRLHFVSEIPLAGIFCC